MASAGYSFAETNRTLYDFQADQLGESGWAKWASLQQLFDLADTYAYECSVV